MRERVEREDRGERPVDVRLQLADATPSGGILVLQRGDVARRDAQQHRLHDRAEKGDADGEGYVEEEERHG
jgi:hypothetical protein